MTSPFSAAAPLAGLLLVSGSSDSVRVAFEPGPGVELSSDLELELSAECVEITIEAFGGPVPEEELPEALTEEFLSAEIELTAGFTDRAFESIEAGGSPARFLRELGELELGALSLNRMGDLAEGTLLRYTRDGDEYDVRVVNDPGDEEGEEPLLTGLISHDLFASFLCPEDELEVGDAWTQTLTAEQILWLLVPGLNLDGLAELPRALGTGEFGQALIEEVLLGMEDGLEAPELGLELQEVEDGIAVLELTGDFSLESDLSLTMSAFANSMMTEEDGVLEDLAAQLELEASLAGSLRYDTRNGLPAGLELEAEWTAAVAGQGEVFDEGELIPIDIRFAWEGTQEVELSSSGS